MKEKASKSRRPQIDDELEIDIRVEILVDRGGGCPMASGRRNPLRCLLDRCRRNESDTSDLSERTKDVLTMGHAIVFKEIVFFIKTSIDIGFDLIFFQSHIS